MVDIGGGVIVDLESARAVRVPSQDGRARNVTAAFVAAATAEISRPALARALILQGLQMLAEAGGLVAAGEYARLILADLARNSSS
jgi:hypothetical protein